MEKGNESEQGEDTAVQAEAGGSSAAPGTGTGTEPAPTGGEGAGGDSGDQPGGGGSQASQDGPTRERDPWADAPDLGETTLPDGTKLRRDADGKMWRGPDSDGNESVWDPEQGRWMDPNDWKEANGTEGWGDPGADWYESWTGQPMPDGWQDVPRAGSTALPEGTLSRDPAGNYELNTPDGQNLKWNEQTGKWYEGASGRETATGLDPVNGWQRGAEMDAQARANPDQLHPYGKSGGASGGSLRP